jgi:glycosyltransferase involved in cell wall biosynthesis
MIDRAPVVQRVLASGVAPRVEPRASEAEHSSPTVAVVADVRGWAFDNIANNLSVILKGKYQIEIIYSNELPEHDLFRILFLDRNRGHVHFLWREPYLRFFFDDQFTDNVISGLAKDLHCERAVAIERLADGMGRTTQTFGVYDHVYLEASSIDKRRPGISFADGYAVSSNKLFGLYASAYKIDPTIETPDGVNQALFRPHNLGRFSETDRPLILGWVGNSEWHNEAGTDPKGLETIIKPAIRQLADDGIPVIAEFADRKERWRPREEMPGYYARIDVLLCASMMEGTPNPVLEAMACGVPVISTDVGIVSEVFGPRQLDFIVARDVASVAGALRKIWMDRRLLAELSEENLAQIKNWDWARFATRWCYLFKTSHAERIRGRGIARALYVRARCANLELSIKNCRTDTRIAMLEVQLDASRSMIKSLESMERSLQSLLEVASWQRKMLRPIHWIWVKALPIRQQIARRRRRG